MTCTHTPACPDATSHECCSAHTVADHSEQGWCQLCKRVILFDDGSYLAPDGHAERVRSLPEVSRQAAPAFLNHRQASVVRTRRGSRRPVPR